MILSRRSVLLAGSAAFASAGLLSACNPAQITKVLSDADMIAQGVQAILPVVQGVVGVSASTVAAVQGAVQRVQAAANVLQSAIGSAGQSAANDLAAGVHVLQLATSGLTLPGWVPAALQAAQTLLPLVLSAAGLALGAGVPSAAAVESARATLRFAAAQ